MAQRPDVLTLEYLLGQRPDADVPLEPLLVKLPSFETLKGELSSQTEYFLNLGLHETARFCAELLECLIQSPRPSPVLTRLLAHNQDAKAPAFAFDLTLPAAPATIRPQLMNVRALFGLREFRRCADHARRLLPEPNALFHYAHATLLAELASGEEPGTSTELQAAEAALRAAPPFDVTLYLLGAIRLAAGAREEAATFFQHALAANPLLWSAWLELGRLLATGEESAGWAALARLPTHWTKNIFTAQLLLEWLPGRTGGDVPCASLCTALLAAFPAAPTLLHLLAGVFLAAQDQDRALELLSRLLVLDPHRLDAAEALSHLLYVREAANELGRLALSAAATDRFSPATCCVLGNHFSLAGERARAAQCFRRAAALDPRSPAPRVLLGHELLELKQVAASVESYHAAVQLNARDHRGWYGLGLAYELQHHFQFAAHYFREAVALCPRDARMWNALATCYEKMGRATEAARCLERVAGLGDPEGLSLFQLGRVLVALGEESRAAQCFERFVDGAAGREAAEALAFLVEHCRVEGRPGRAAEFAARLLELPGVPREEAHNLLYALGG